MAAIAFDTLKYARKLMAAGIPVQQAEAQAEIMAEAFLINTDALVTKDYLDARFAEFEARMESRMDSRFAENNQRIDKRFAEQGARIDALAHRMELGFSDIHGKLRLQNWILAVVVASTVLPALQQLLT